MAQGQMGVGFPEKPTVSVGIGLLVVALLCVAGELWLLRQVPSKTPGKPEAGSQAPNPSEGKTARQKPVKQPKSTDAANDSKLPAEPFPLFQPLVIFFAGGIGSCITTILAFLRHACEEKDFDPAYAPWYFVRPLLGMLLALIFFFGLKGGLLVITYSQSPMRLNDWALATVGALVGMFSKDAIEKLREVFRTIFSVGNEDTPSTAGG